MIVTRPRAGLGIRLLWALPSDAIPFLQLGGAYVRRRAIASKSARIPLRPPKRADRRLLCPTLRPRRAACARTHLVADNVATTMRPARTSWCAIRTPMQKTGRALSLMFKNEMHSPWGGGRHARPEHHGRRLQRGERPQRRGDIVGSLLTAALSIRAFVRDPLPGGYSAAHAVDAAGQIVGGSTLASGALVPVIYHDGVPRALATPVDAPSTKALAINASGELVGYGHVGGNISGETRPPVARRHAHRPQRPRPGRPRLGADRGTRHQRRRANRRQRAARRATARVPAVTARGAVGRPPHSKAFSRMLLGQRPAKMCTPVP